jgi:hypothetical protein
MKTANTRLELHLEQAKHLQLCLPRADTQSGRRKTQLFRGQYHGDLGRLGHAHSTRVCLGFALTWEPSRPKPNNNNLHLDTTVHSVKQPSGTEEEHHEAQIQNLKTNI